MPTRYPNFTSPSPPHASEKLDIFAPQNFEDYVGQERAKQVAQVMISAAQLEHRPLPNILIDGSYGLGKTSLAKIIHRAAGLSTKVTDAAAFNKEVTYIREPLILDEIHNLDPVVADSLNIGIDAGRIHIIGCTTNPGLIPAPLKSRFREIHLEPYTLDDIQRILQAVVDRKGIFLNPALLKDIAKRSRLNPRHAVNNLSFLFDWMAVKGNDLTSTDLKDAFTALGIDANGLTQRDYKYLAALDPEQPTGLSHLAAVLSVDAKTIERDIEPYLLQKGYVGRMPRGRIRLKDL